jgi:hypothetical protein
VPKYAPAGKIDFHALRTAYINQVIYSGTDPKTAQELARHENLSLTMNVYGRARQERMAAAVEAVGAAVLNRSDGGNAFSRTSGTGVDGYWTGLDCEKRPPESQRMAAGAESLLPPMTCIATDTGELPVGSSKSHSTQSGCGRQSSGQGSSQPGHGEAIMDSAIVDGRTDAAIPLTHENTLRTPEKVQPESNGSSTEVQRRNPSEHPKSTPHLPPDLAGVVSAWDALPSAVRAGIVAMVAASMSR